MSKLAKFKGGAKRLGGFAAKGIMKGGDASTTPVGLKIVTLGVHAGLATASKHMSEIGPIPVRPDVAGIGIGLGMALLGKKKMRKLGWAVAEGALHACITRGVAMGSFTVLNGSVAHTPYGQVQDTTAQAA